MGTITVVGLGPGCMDDLTIGAIKALRSEKPVFLRTERHPAAGILRELMVQYTALDDIYQQAQTFDEVYQTITQRLCAAAAGEDIVYAVPGQGALMDDSVAALNRAAKLVFVPGVDETTAQVAPRLAGSGGYAIVSGQDIEDYRPNIRAGLIVAQIDSAMEAGRVKLALGQWYPDEHTVVWFDRESTREMPLYALDRQRDYHAGCCVYLPALPWGQGRYTFAELQGILARLRGPGGCPWDRAQTHQSLKDALLEETYEVHEAIDAQDPEALCEELGDVLLQVFFHGGIAQEKADFDTGDIVDGICKKLIGRHPHVFGGAKADTASEALGLWEEAKQLEKGRTGPLDGICQALPGLLLAEKALSRAEKSVERLYERIEIPDGVAAAKNTACARDDKQARDAMADWAIAFAAAARRHRLNPEAVAREGARKLMRAIDDL